MMYQNKLKILLFIVVLSIATASAQNNITFDAKNNRLTSCNAVNECQTINTPAELNEKLNTSVITIELFADDKKYLLLTPKSNTSANICYDLYLISNTEISTAPSFILPEKPNNTYPDGNDLCMGLDNFRYVQPC